MRPIVLAAALAALLAPLAAAAAGETEIHLTETATRTMAPDRLRASLRAETRGSSARQAQADLNQRMAQALARAKAAQAVTASTGAYRVGRDLSAKDQSWLASETLTLTSADFAAVLSLAGALQGEGMAVAGIEFFLAPETIETAQAALTATALAALRARAADVARDLGMTVDHYRAIDVGNAAANGIGPIRPMAMGPAALAMPPPVAEAGDQTITLSVSADIVLAPPKS